MRSRRPSISIDTMSLLAGGARFRAGLVAGFLAALLAVLARLAVGRDYFPDLPATEVDEHRLDRAVLQNLDTVGHYAVLIIEAGIDRLAAGRPLGGGDGLLQGDLGVAQRGDLRRIV